MKYLYTYKEKSFRMGKGSRVYSAYMGKDKNEFVHYGFFITNCVNFLLGHRHSKHSMVTFKRQFKEFIKE